MTDFQDALDFCNLRDAGFFGIPWTWTNKQVDGVLIKVRLDHFVAMNDWMEIYPCFRVDNIKGYESDHNVIVLHTNYRDMGRRNCKRFKFEAMWQRHPDCEQIVSDCWRMSSGGSAFKRVMGCIKSCSYGLKDWNRSTFGNIQKKIEQCRERLEAYDLITDGSVDPQVYKNVKIQLEDLLEKDELAWKQRSRIQWIRERDRNTKYFHSKASTQRRKNFISGIEDNCGIWVENVQGIEHTFVDYFQDIFKSSLPVGIEEVVEVLEVRVLEDMNRGLSQPVTFTAIKEAAFQIGAWKAPGPDGMNGLFYQSYWHIVGA